MDQAIAEFTGVTGSSDRDQACQYLQVTDGNLEQAVALYFETGGIDLESRDRAPPPTTTQATNPSRPSRSRPQGRVDQQGVVHLDSDDEVEFAGLDEDDDEPVVVPPRTSSTRPGPAQPAPQILDDDEAVARRLQEEIYGGGRISPERDADGVRAPMARTTETLLGSDDGLEYEGDGDIRGAIEAQLAARRSRGRAGIFNQRSAAPSVWGTDSSERRAELSRATGGASEMSSKATSLAEMYRPPFELLENLPFKRAQEIGRNEEKWLLINIQDSAIFDCQILNRDIWKNESIKETVKENFIFLQYDKNDPMGSHYYQYYFQDRERQQAYPHVAIVDPRTGEQVKKWSGMPFPKAPEFLIELHEFLDRYSLKANARNPVPPSKPKEQPPPKPVNTDAMTEDEMLELAMRNSMDTAAATSATNGGAASTGQIDKGKQPANIPPPSSTAAIPQNDTAMPDAPSTSSTSHPATSTEPTLPSSSQTPLFARIPSSQPHSEPAAGTPSTTRIQFRHSGGRVIRRFALSDAVQRIYEWLKAAPLNFDTEEQRGGSGEFELVCQGKNLLLDVEAGKTIQEAGLANATVMVEFL